MVFSDFITSCELIDRQYVNIATVDRLFISANYSENNANNAKELIRFEFFEVIVRIARARYFDSKQQTSYGVALELLMNDYLTNFTSAQTWQQWRSTELWCLEVNDIYEANLTPLLKVYNSIIIEKRIKRPNMQEV